MISSTSDKNGVRYTVQIREGKIYIPVYRKILDITDSKVKLCLVSETEDNWLDLRRENIKIITKALRDIPKQITY
jgi:hypothetical protein